jgi:hypothetical protein
LLFSGLLIVIISWLQNERKGQPKECTTLPGNWLKDILPNYLCFAC